MRKIALALALLAWFAAPAVAQTYAYSNNGLSFRAVPSGYVAGAGEVVFNGIATTQQLGSAFPASAPPNIGYTVAAAEAQAPQMLATNMADGIDITAGGANSAPVATFALDPVTQQQMAGIAATVGLLGAFPGGGTTYVYPDINGSPQTFPSVAAFKSFYAAYTTLLEEMNAAEATLAVSGTASWPSQSVALQ